MPQLFSEQTVAFDIKTRTIVLYVGSLGDILHSFHVNVTDGFNDPAATIQIGTNIDHAAIMTPLQILAQVAGEYAREEMYVLGTAAEKYVYFMVAPGISSSGRGLVRWTFVKNPGGTTP